MLVKTPDSSESIYIHLDFFSSNIKCGKFKIYFEKTGYITIWDVKIEQKYQGKGLGKQMMKECLDYIKEFYPEFHRIILFVIPGNDRATHVYESVGFISKEENDIRPWCNLMEILL